MLQMLKLENFTPCLQQDFVLSQGDDTKVVLTLIEAQPSKYPPFRPPWQGADAAPQRQPFWLLFRGPVAIALPQRMYTLQNATLGVIEDLFLTPIGMDARGRYYEAIFN